MQRVLVIGGLWLSACGPQTGPAPTTPDSSASAANDAAKPVAPPAAEASPLAEAAPTETASAAESKPAAEAQPAAPSIHDVCFAMCDTLKPKCPKSSFEACQVNCGKYDPPAPGCEEIVRAALSCARDANDLVCAHVAPESCAKSFRRIAACAAGQSTTETAAAPTGLPPGFALYEDAREGVHAPMPEGVAAGTGDTLATVKTADGAVYSIRKLPRPEGKLNEKVFLKIGMNLFGRCSDKMKMQGRVDKPGRNSINFTTKCPDGSEEQGLFWATDRALFVASAKGPAGKLGPTEAFLYGFEAK